MDVKQAAEYIGKTVTVRLESLAVACKVLDVKQAYGNWRLLVEPVAGSGQQWVDVSRVHFLNVEVPCKQ